MQSRFGLACWIMAAVALLSAISIPVHAGAPEELQIYFIDVEGGQSTLIVTPDHQSLLIDAGFAGEGTFDARAGDPVQARDANRVLAAAREAGLRQIDYLLATHFHGDHIGGVPELSKLLPIRNFVDHGGPNPDAEKSAPGTLEAFHAYATARATGQHLEPEPGDRLPLKEIDAVVVSTAGRTLAGPLPGAGKRNLRCSESIVPAAEPYENPRSTGVLVTFGRFRFLDLGDLTGEPLFKLACPSSMIGHVDVYLIAHHGGADVADPAIFAAYSPRVAIMNNGLKKGGARNTFDSLHRVEGLEATWQLHWSDAAKEANFAPPFIANPDESSANWIKLTARRDGSFGITNGRSGDSAAYPAPGLR